MTAFIDNSYSRIKPLYEYLQKQSDNRRFTRTVEVAATFLLISFFLIFAIRPTLLTISALLGDIKSKELSNLQMKNKIDDVMRAQDSFSLIQERFLIVESSLPSRPNYFQSFDEIQYLATASGIKIDASSFGLDESVDKANPKIKTFSQPVSINQPFDQSLKFITDLLSARRLVSIGEINFVASEKSSFGMTPTDGEVSTNFTPVFYYWDSQNEKK